MYHSIELFEIPSACIMTSFACNEIKDGSSGEHVKGKRGSAAMHTP